MANSALSTPVATDDIPAEIVNDEITDADRDRMTAYFAENFPGYHQLLSSARRSN